MPEKLSAMEQAELLKKQIIEEREKLQKDKEAIEAERTNLATERVLGGMTPSNDPTPKKKSYTPKEYALAADRGILLE